MIHDPVWSDTDTDAADFLYFPAHTTAMVSAFVDYAFGDQGCAPFAAADEDHIPFPDDLLLDLPPLLEVTDSGLLLADNLAFLLQKHLDTEAHDCSCPQDPAGFCDLVFEEVAADIITVYDSGFSLPDPALPLGGDHTPHTAPDHAGDADGEGLRVPALKPMDGSFGKDIHGHLHLHCEVGDAAPDYSEKAAPAVLNAVEAQEPPASRFSMDYDDEAQSVGSVGSAASLHPSPHCWVCPGFLDQHFMVYCTDFYRCDECFIDIPPGSCQSSWYCSRCDLARCDVCQDKFLAELEFW